MVYTRIALRPEKLVLAADAGEPFNVKGNMLGDRCPLFDATGT
jgi:hypothetical protein